MLGWRMALSHSGLYNVTITVTTITISGGGAHIEVAAQHTVRGRGRPDQTNRIYRPIVSNRLNDNCRLSTQLLCKCRG